MVDIPSHIFKSYDIRGLVDSELSEELAHALGSAFVDFLRKQGQDFTGKKMVVGRDMRETSMPFSRAVIAGIQEQGVDVVDIGLCTTPLFNFSCAHIEEHVGGIIVTASHNPSEYNGFKLCLGNGLAVGKVNGMEEIRDSILNKTYDVIEGEKGGLEERDMFPLYQERIFSFISPKEIKPMKIVIDNANGMGGVTFPRLLKSLPQVEVEYLFIEPDGTFPNHEANPIKTETLKDLQANVLEVGADLGLALDGDADRIGAVNEKGEVIDGSFVVTLIGQQVLKNNPGATMLYDLRLSRIAKEMWEGAGAKTIITPVGHTNIKKMMRDNGAVFGGELSLHLYFDEMYKIECTELSLLYLLRTLSQENKPMSQILSPLQKYFHSGEINFEVEDKDGMLEALKEKYAPNAIKQVDIDGLWLEFDWGWFNARKSNTEPVLRLNLEAWEEGVMEEKLTEIKNFIEK